MNVKTIEEAAALGEWNHPIWDQFLDGMRTVAEVSAALGDVRWTELFDTGIGISEAPDGQ